MNMPVKLSLTELASYRKLEHHFQNIKQLHMRRLFSVDPERVNKLSIEHEDLLLDYSKNRISLQTIPLLCDLARDVHLESWRERMFNGEKINNTERRAVLHTALRNCTSKPVMVDGEDVMPKINATIDKMEAFSNRVRQGEWKGYTGKVITDIVNVGIGGSDLGPKMVYQTLKPYWHERLSVHFVSNVDGRLE